MLRHISIAIGSRWLQNVLGAALLALFTLQNFPAYAFTDGTSGEGAPAPEFLLPGTSEPVSLSSLRGKVVYLDFWASWCAPCRRSFPWMVELRNKFKSDELAIVAINVDAKRKDADKFLRAVSANGITVLFDSEGVTPPQFSVDSMPSSYVIDKTGRITRVFHGFRDTETSQIESAIQRALKQ